MFPLTLWDNRARRLIAARDRLGEKPLYYYCSGCAGGRGLLVASEVSALAASGLVPTDLGPAALLAYLTFGSVPAPLTMLRAVRALPPAHLLVWQGDELTVRRYWSPPSRAGEWESRLGPAEAAEALSERLDEAVSLCTAAHVPVGVFLSGGLDSAAVATLLAARGESVRTHCLALPGSPLDEAPRARAVARELGACHLEHAVDGATLERVLPELVARLDQPSVDGVNTFVLSRAARASGTVVALSGLGGDELFGGYPVVRLVPRLAAMAAAARRAATAGVAALLARAPGAPFCRASRLAWALTERRVPALVRTYLAARGLFTPPALEVLLEPDFLAAARRELDPTALLEAVAGDGGEAAPGNGAVCSSPDEQAWRALVRWERQLYLAGQLLRDTETLAMAHALEVRAPLLDHRLVELVDRLPLRLTAASGKTLLRRALGGLLPPSAGRGRKRGFILPRRAAERTSSWGRVNPIGEGPITFLSVNWPFVGPMRYQLAWLGSKLVP